MKKIILIMVSIKKQTINKHKLINTVNIKEAECANTRPLSIENNYST